MRLLTLRYPVLPPKDLAKVVACEITWVVADLKRGGFRVFLDSSIVGHLRSCPLSLVGPKWSGCLGKFRGLCLPWEVLRSLFDTGYKKVKILFRIIVIT